MAPYRRTGWRQFLQKKSRTETKRKEPAYLAAKNKTLKLLRSAKTHKDERLLGALLTDPDFEENIEHLRELLSRHAFGAHDPPAAQIICAWMRNTDREAGCGPRGDQQGTFGCLYNDEPESSGSVRSAPQRHRTADPELTIGRSVVTTMLHDKYDRATSHIGTIAKVQWKTAGGRPFVTVHYKHTKTTMSFEWGGPTDKQMMLLDDPDLVQKSCYHMRTIQPAGSACKLPVQQVGKNPPPPPPVEEEGIFSPGSFSDTDTLLDFDLDEIGSDMDFNIDNYIDQEFGAAEKLDEYFTTTGADPKSEAQY